MRLTPKLQRETSLACAPRIVNKTALASLAKEISLGEYLYLGVGEASSGGKQRESILADTFEAIVAAVYLDGDIQTCKSLVAKFTAGLIASPDQRQRKDFKTRLQELLQARGETLPLYKVIDTSGQAHAQEFLVECSVSLLPDAQQGRGASKRSAEQDAAKAVLQLLGELHNDE